jgi:hypothetical protein
LHDRKCWLVPLVACPVVLWGWLASGQQQAAPSSTEPSETPAATPAEPPSQPIKEAPSPMIFVLDEKGNPVQTLHGWSLDDFWELYERAEGREQTDQPPRYVFQSMSATGTVKAGVAELTIRLNVWTRDEDWTRVPIGIEQVVSLPERVEHQGDGECFLHLDEEGKGYAVWLRGAAQRQHELTLNNVRVPLALVGDEGRLRLSIPRRTSSELKLTVPWGKAVAEVSEGATLDVISSEGRANTEFKARWAGGDFEITFGRGETWPSGTRPVLEAKSVLVAKIDKRAVVTEARLRVRGDGRPFDRFRVFLPGRAELIRGNSPGCSVTPVAEGAVTGEERLFEVRRDKKLVDPIEVRLTTRQSREAATSEGSFELGGFEVIDAIQQRGHVAVAAAGNWQVRCVPGRGVRQIEALPDDVQAEMEGEIPASGFAYLFEYFSQPFSLTARVVEITSHVRVEPEYRIDVQDEQVQLEATLKYTVRGAKAIALGVELPGWSLDEAGPDNVVLAEDVPVGKSGSLSIPLAHPSTGEIEISILAHQPIPAGAASLSLELPRPRADSLSPAVVAVFPADNVELTPDPEAIKGLVRQQVEPQIELRQGQQEPLFYRGETGEAVFVADFEIHAQKVSVEVTGDIVLGEKKAEVRQTLAYTIAYERLEALDVEVPGSLAGPDTLELLVDGQRLAPVPLSGQASPPEASDTIRQRIVLPGPRIGRCELQIRYATELKDVLPNTTVTEDVPLIMPAGGDLSSNRLYVTAPQGIEVGLRGQDWQVSQGLPGRLPRPNILALSTDRPIGNVSLGIHREDLATTVVEAAWVQTYLTQTTRWERAVFRFTTDQEQLELILPEGADFRQVEVVMGPENVDDRQRLSVQPMTSESRLLIPVPDDSSHRRQCLEVRYGFLDPRPPPGRLSLELPQLAAEVWVQRTYWELLLPRNEHVIVAPDGFTGEFRWGWTGSFWGRKPLLEQAELEAWSAAGHAAEMPEATSRYLFSSLAPVARCELRTANRWLIVLVASSAVLGVGLLLIYVPACRHPALLFVAAVVLLGAVALYPGPALLAAQAASLGLALALLGGLLNRLFGPGRGRGGRPDTSSSVFERSSTHAQYPPPAVGKEASTDTVPAPVPLRTSDSNP